MPNCYAHPMALTPKNCTTTRAQDHASERTTTLSCPVLSVTPCVNNYRKLPNAYYDATNSTSTSDEPHVIGAPCCQRCENHTSHKFHVANIQNHTSLHTPPLLKHGVDDERELMSAFATPFCANVGTSPDARINALIARPLLLQTVALV